MSEPTYYQSPEMAFSAWYDALPVEPAGEPRRSKRAEARMAWLEADRRAREDAALDAARAAKPTTGECAFCGKPGQIGGRCDRHYMASCGSPGEVLECKGMVVAARAAKPSEPNVLGTVLQVDPRDGKPWTRERVDSYVPPIEMPPSIEHRVREIALAVVNEVGAGKKVGEQMVKLEAEIARLEDRQDSTWKRITQGEDRFIEKIAALESKSTPTTAEPSPLASEESYEARPGGSCARCGGPISLVKDGLKIEHKPGCGSSWPSENGWSSMGITQGETVHRLPSSVLDLARSIFKAGEPAPKPDGPCPVDSFHFALADELLAQHARAEGAEARGYEHGVQAAADLIASRAAEKFHPATIGRIDGDREAQAIRALLSPREGGKGEA